MSKCEVCGNDFNRGQVVCHCNSCWNKNLVTSRKEGFAEGELKAFKFVWDNFGNIPKMFKEELGDDSETYMQVDNLMFQVKKRLKELKEKRGVENP